MLRLPLYCFHDASPFRCRRLWIVDVGAHCGAIQISEFLLLPCITHDNPTGILLVAASRTLIGGIEQVHEHLLRNRVRLESAHGPGVMNYVEKVTCHVCH